LSVVTVSKVIRNNSDIGEETRQCVLKRLKERKYQPNIAARALVTGRSYSAGLIVPELVHPFFAEIASGTVENFRRIEAQKLPYVLIDRVFLGMPANFVGVDDVAVGRLATDHLISTGCRKIGHIRGLTTSTAAGRLEGYRQTPAHHDVRQFRGYVLAGRAVIGCGNLHFDKFLRVPLSSVNQQSRAIGARAGKLVLSPIEAKIEPQPKSAMLQPSLVARASTRRLP
jgi:LacI family transcriptional regulator